MTKRQRTVLFSTLLGLFFILAPSFALYSQGYRIDFQGARIAQTGAFYLKANPSRVDVLIDASGIRIVGRSIWYSIRIKKRVSRRECDKIHIAICSDTHVILNWFISEGKKADSPYFKWLLLPFEKVGIVCADPGYLSRENFKIVLDKLGSLFIPFKKNSIGRSMGSWMWKTSFWLWKKANSVYMKIYHQRSKVECVFSALKKRYGDKLNCRTESARRNEMAMRFIAYNIRVIIHYQYAVDNGLNLFARAK